jgi:hypothetical protein
LSGIGERVEFEAAFGLGAAMAFDALRFEDGLDVFEVVEAAFVRVLRFTPAMRAAMKCRWHCWREAFAGSRAPSRVRIFCQPGFRGLAALVQ